MFLAHIYRSRADIPKGTETLYRQQGTAFIREGRDLDVDNPWEGDKWNLTAQGKFLEQYGEILAAAFAKSAGTTIGGLKPRVFAGPLMPIPNSNFTVIVQRKGLLAPVGGGGLIGAGSSGTGEPD